MNCAIIGSGQLGSRHLQGLLKYNHEPLIVYVYDTAHESLSLAKSRAEKINHKHQIFYIQDFEKLPKDIFLAIIATNSIVRAEVTQRLLKHSRISHLILEKVLFPEIDSYAIIGILLQETETQTYVNHPRRKFASYKNLKQNLLSLRKHQFLLHGGQWGLACNALHFIDLFEFLSDSYLTNINTDLLNPLIHKSKRQHYIEFTGTLQGRLNNGTTFSITSSNTQSIIAPHITFSNNNERLIIHESKNSGITYYNLKTGLQEEKLPFTMEFQSALTNKLLEDIVVNGNCNLTKYNHAAATHTCFLQSILSYYNQLTQIFDNKILPIT